MDYPPEIRFFLGEAYRLRGEEGDAGRAFEAHLLTRQNAPDYAPTHRALGLHYMKNGENQSALQHFERYLELLPTAADRAYVEQYLQTLREEAA